MTDTRLSNSISLFCSVFALTLAAEYYWLRPSEALPVLLIVSLALLLINLPAGVRLITQREAWYLGEGSVVLGGWLILIAAGLIAGMVQIALVLPFAVIGWALLLVTLIAGVRGGHVIRDALLIALAIGFGLWMAGQQWGFGYHDPYFAERAAHGSSMIDTAYHAAIANMIKTYGFPSTGLDGLVYLHYWYASHFMFAQIANLTGLSALAMYQLAFPLIIMPLFVYSLLIFALTVQRQFFPREWSRLDQVIFWLLIPTAIVGFIDGRIAAAAALWQSYLFSESFTTSMMIAFLGMALVIEAWRAGASWALIGIVPALLAVIGFAKGSIMLILFAVLLYLFVRLGMYRQKRLVIGMAVTAITVFAVYRLISFADSDYTHLDLLSFPKNYAGIGWGWLWYIFAFIWAYLFIALRLAAVGLRSWRDVIEAVRQRSALDVEFVALTAAASAGPALIFFIPDGAGVYFWDFQRWVAVAMLLAVIPALTARIPPRRRYLLAILGAALAPALITNLVSMIGRDRMIAAALPEASERSAQVITLLQGLDALPADQKRETVVFIPHTNDAYWGIQEQCRADPFTAPALSGLAMLDGLPPADCHAPLFGYWDYTLRSTPQTLRADDHDALCAAAQSRGFSHIIVIEDVAWVDVGCARP